MDENLRKLAQATNWLNTNKTRENTDKLAENSGQIVEELKKLNQTQKDIRRCPYCKGGVTIGAEICMHCNNPIIWLHDKVGKQGEEGRLKHEFESQRQRAQKRVDKWLLPDDEWKKKKRSSMTRKQKAAEAELKKLNQTPSPSNMLAGTLSETANDSSRSGVEELRKELLRLHESGEDELTGGINEGVLQLAYRINLEEEYQWDEYGVLIHTLLDLQYDESLAPDAALWDVERSFRESTT